MIADGTHLLAGLAVNDVEVASDHLVVDLPLHAGLCNTRGTLFGGFLATLADMVGGRLANVGLVDGGATPTADLSIHYLAPVTIGPARAVARILRRGSRTIVVSVEISDLGTNRLAAVATMSCSVLGPRSPA